MVRMMAVTNGWRGKYLPQHLFLKFPVDGGYSPAVVVVNSGSCMALFG